MKKAICHYSFHRTLAEEQWTLDDFVDQCRSLNVEGIDFHQRFLPDPEKAADAILKALEGTGLELSGLSLSTNFNKDGDDFQREIEQAVKWIGVASQAGARVSRIFGGHIKDRNDEKGLASALEKVLSAMSELTKTAEEHNVILAIENHGGVPGIGEEQVNIIEQIDSPFLKATVDVGNYMSCGQDPVAGSTLAAPYCAYVHLKDLKKSAQGLDSCAVGEGDVDHAGCLSVLNEAGYKGYVALEYEGSEDERQGVRKSIDFMHEVMSSYEWMITAKLSIPDSSLYWQE